MDDVHVTDLAWAAGVFDHGGYVIAKNRTLYLRVRFPFDRVQAMRFSRILGVGKLYGPYRRSNALVYQYELTGRGKVGKVIEMLRPYLTFSDRFERLLEPIGSSEREASSYLSLKEEAEPNLSAA